MNLKVLMMVLLTISQLSCSVKKEYFLKAKPHKAIHHHKHARIFHQVLETLQLHDIDAEECEIGHIIGHNCALKKCRFYQAECHNINAYECSADNISCHNLNMRKSEVNTIACHNANLNESTVKEIDAHNVKCQSQSGVHKITAINVNLSNSTADEIYIKDIYPNNHNRRVVLRNNASVGSITFKGERGTVIVDNTIDTSKIKLENCDCKNIGID